MSNDIFTNPTSGSAASEINAVKKRIDNSNKKLAKKQTGLPNDTIEEISKASGVMARVNASVNSLFKQLTPTTATSADVSNTSIDALYSLSKNNIEANRKSASNATNSKVSKEKLAGLESLKKEVLAANNTNLSNMLQLHKAKFADQMATNNLIIRIIPKMRLALNTFATSILSPDDFSKSALTVSINDSNLSTDVKNRATRRASALLDHYEITKGIRNDIISYLVNGRLFYLVSSVNEDISRMLNEGTSVGSLPSIYKNIGSSYTASMTKTALNESVLSHKPVSSQYVKEMMDVFGIAPTTNLSEGSSVNVSAEYKAAEAIDKFLNEEFIISDSRALMADSSDLLLTEGELNSSLSFFNNSKDLPKPTSVNDPRQYIPLAQPEYTDGDEIKAEELGVGSGGAVVRRISPANIVPLEYQGRNYGFIHLDIVEIDPDNEVMPIDSEDSLNGLGGSGMGMLPSSADAMNNGSILQNIVSSGRDMNINGNNELGGMGKKNYENPTGSPGLTTADDARLMFIAKAFANRLSKETNLKLLKRDATLRQAIYNGLAIKKLCSNQRVRIVYLKPEEVVYINRGQSIFDNVLFFCKLYIATLITILMQNVLNGGDKRLIFVEIGEDNNGATAVQQVVRDLKSNEISSVMNMDIQSVLNIQTQFKDLYIPVVDGEKPVSFETMDSLANKSMDDDFLNWLSGNIFSGMGLPTAFLQEVENVDFAKLLSMQNSRYLREVLTEQNVLSPGFTELLQKIYKVAVVDNVSEAESKNKKSGNPAIDDEQLEPSTISVRLPVPVALALNSITDQMSNASSAIDTILQSSTHIAESGVTENDKENLQASVRARLLRKFVTSASWEEIDNEVRTAVQDFVEARTKAQIDKDDAEDENAEEASEDY